MADPRQADPNQANPRHADPAPREDTGPHDPRNLSTDHQRPGDAKRPRDTLDSPNAAAHWPKDFDPAGDVGKATPSGNPTDREG